MTTFRIITGLLLALAVSPMNGFAGIGYTIGGEFEISMQGAAQNTVEIDPRWVREEGGNGVTMGPRDGMATLSLLLDSKFGRFGVFLQALSALQFIGGLLIAIRPAVGSTALAFLALLAMAGLTAEFTGVQYTSTWGITNALGIGVSFALIPLGLQLHRKFVEDKS